MKLHVYLYSALITWAWEFMSGDRKLIYSVLYFKYPLFITPGWLAGKAGFM